MSLFENRILPAPLLCSHLSHEILFIENGALSPGAAFALGQAGCRPKFEGTIVGSSAQGQGQRA